MRDSLEKKLRTNKTMLLHSCKLVVFLFVFVGIWGCTKKNEAQLAPTITPFNIAVSNIQVINQKLVITGTNLDQVTHFKIQENGTTTNLAIESQNATSITAGVLSNVNFAAGKVLDFVFSNAYAQSIFQVNFSLCDSTLNGAGFNCSIAPNDKEVLAYDASSGQWRPRAVNGLSYKGTWDAFNDPEPVAVDPGDYYVVSVANSPFDVGDWIVFNGTTYDHIDNSQTIVSVFGRTGAITATKGDYELNELADVDTAGLATGKVLKYDGTNWVPDDDLSGGGAGSVSTTELADGAVTYSKMNLTDGDIPLAKVNGLVSALSGKEPSITAGTSAQYYRGDKTFQALNTDAVPEGVALYFTNARALGVPLTGLDVADATAVLATDSLLVALGKTQGQINSLSSESGNYLIKDSSDTITGEVTVNGVSARLTIIPTPALLTDATNKQYVDGEVAKALPLTGGTLSGNLGLRSGANTVTIKSHATTNAYDFTLPQTAGSANYFLQTDGAGNLTWGTPSTPNTTAVAEGTNLYFTEARARTAVVDDGMIVDGITNKAPSQNAVFDALALKQNVTSLASDIRIVTLTGLSTLNGALLTVGDSILGAFGKLQRQISDLNGNTYKIVDAVPGNAAANKDYVDNALATGANQWTADSGDVYRPAGNVGIGMTNPTTKLEVACPAGFINIKSGANQLGCMQEDLQGSANWPNALNACFTAYGGRLPTRAEWLISMNNFTLQNLGTEWNSDVMTFGHARTPGSYLVSVSSDIWTTNQSGASVENSYRCWIPR